jgi:hypothetical protein
MRWSSHETTPLIAPPGRLGDEPSKPRIRAEAGGKHRQSATHLPPADLLCITKRNTPVSRSGEDNATGMETSGLIIICRLE